MWEAFSGALGHGGRKRGAASMRWRPILLVCSLTLAAGIAAASPEIVRKKDEAGDKKAAFTWLDLHQGLEKLRDTRKPALIWYAGEPSVKKPSEKNPSEKKPSGKKDGEGHPGAAGDQPKGFFTEFLEHPDFRRKVERFVLIRLRGADLLKPYPRRKLPQIPRKPARFRVGKPGAGKANRPLEKKTKPPPVVREVLRVIEGQPVLLVLDFRETIVRRYDGDDRPPARSALRKEFNRVVRNNAYHVKVARKVEKILADSEEQFRRGKVRKAVILVRGLESPTEKATFDRVLLAQVEKVIKDYRGRAEKGLKKATELVDAAKKSPGRKGKNFLDALAILSRVARDYPFKDVIAQTREQRGVILSFLRIQGAPIPGGFRGTGTSPGGRRGHP